MAAANLLPLSRRKWRGRGYYVEGTESIIRLPGGITRRSDLFGFSDMVAVKAGEPLVFLQITSASNVPARLRKIREESTGTGQWTTPLKDLAEAVILSGARVVIEGWAKNKSRRYECRELEVTLDLLKSDDPTSVKHALRESLVRQKTGNSTVNLGQTASTDSTGKSTKPLRRSRKKRSSGA